MLPLLLLLQTWHSMPHGSQNSGHKWWGLDVNCIRVNLPPNQTYPSGSFSSNRINWVKPVQGSEKSHVPSMFQKSSMRHGSCGSGHVNVFQWNREWFLSRRMKFGSEFNVMVVYEACRLGPMVVYRFTGIRKWVMRLWKRPFWFSKKVNVTLSLNWSMPYQGGCSQFLISSRGFDSSICDWKNKFSFLGKYHLFRIESFWVNFRCVHRLQLLKVCDQYVTLPNSPRVQSVSEEQSW